MRSEKSKTLKGQFSLRAGLGVGKPSSRYPDVSSYLPHVATESGSCAELPKVLLPRIYATIVCTFGAISSFPDMCWQTGCCPPSASIWQKTLGSNELEGALIPSLKAAHRTSLCQEYLLCHDLLLKPYLPLSSNKDHFLREVISDAPMILRIFR